MANALQEIVGTPQAPSPPDIEDILGPPPHAPRIGRGGPIGSARRGRSGASRPPSPPHIAKPSQPPQAAPQPVRQPIIQEVKPQPYKPPVATPDKTPPEPQNMPKPRAMGRAGQVKAAREAARQNEEGWRANAGPEPEHGREAFEAIRAKAKAQQTERTPEQQAANDAQDEEIARRNQEIEDRFKRGGEGNP